MALRPIRPGPFDEQSESSADVMALIRKVLAAQSSPPPGSPALSDTLLSGIKNTQAAYEAALSGLPGAEGDLSGALATRAEGAALGPKIDDPWEMIKAGDVAGLGRATRDTLVQSSPQLAATLAGGAGGFALAGPPGALGGAAIANLPYFYGSNLLEQAENKKTRSVKDLNRTSAAVAAVPQAAMESLLTVLFPQFKVAPGMAGSIITRMGRGTLRGAVLGSSTEALQEAASIIQADPSLEKLFDEDSLKRLRSAAILGATSESVIGAAGQIVPAAPSLNKSPQTVQERSAAHRFFTRRSLDAKPNSTVVYVDPNEIMNLSGAPDDIDANQARIFSDLPELDLISDDSGGAYVRGVNNKDAISYLAKRGVRQIPIRLTMPEGMQAPPHIQWGNETLTPNLDVSENQGKGTAKKPVNVRTQADLDVARKVANRGRGPGFIKSWGMDIAIEKPKGQLRTGTNGETEWSSVTPADYGFIKRTDGGDGEPLDVWLGPNLNSGQAFVIEQVNPDTGFDEHKAMLGFDSQEEAIAAYDASFSDSSGPARRGAIQPLPISKFRAWAQEGDTKKQISTAIDELPVTVDDIHGLADDLGIEWDNNPEFMALTEQVSSTLSRKPKRHLDELSQPELRRMAEILDTLKQGGGSVDGVVNPMTISWEAERSKSLPEGDYLKPLADATDQQKSRRMPGDGVIYLKKIDSAFRDPNTGRDAMADALGLGEISSLVGRGAYQNEANPVTQTSAITAAVDKYTTPQEIKIRTPQATRSITIPRLTNQTRDLLQAYAAVRGAVSKQDSVGWNFAVGVDKDVANGIDVSIGESISNEDFERVVRAMQKAGIDTSSIVPIQTPTGMRVWALQDQVNGEIVHDPSFVEKAAQVVTKELKKYKPEIGYKFVDSGLAENTWKDNPNGEGYAHTFNKVATDDSRRIFRDILSKIDAAERSEAESKGLGYKPEVNRKIGSAFGTALEAGKERPSVSLGGLEPSVESQKTVYGMFGKFTPNEQETDIKYYDLSPALNRPWLIDKMLDAFGFRVKYFSFEDNPENGVKWRPPNLKTDGYNNGTLWIYNPRNSHGSFDDAAYTNAWRVAHELAHAITERVVERKYGASRREGRLGRPAKSYRGAPGKEVEIEVRPLTLKEAQRAVEWEDVAFRTQRKLMKEFFGVDIAEDQFNSEYNNNLADATYRVVSGDFGDPGKRGFVPDDSEPADLRMVLAKLAETEAKLAADVGKVPTKGVDLKKWRQVRDDEIDRMIERAKNKKRGARSDESENIGLPGQDWRDTANDILPNVRSQLFDGVKKLEFSGKEGFKDVATPKEWRDRIWTDERVEKVSVRDANNKVIPGKFREKVTQATSPLGVSKNEIRWSGILEWLDSLDPSEPITKSQVLQHIADTKPRIKEVYYGDKPPPIIKGRYAQEADTNTLPSKSEQKDISTILDEVYEPVSLSDFDNPDERGEVDEDALSDYVDDRFDEEADYQFGELDLNDRRRFARDRMDLKDKGKEYLSQIDMDDHGFAIFRDEDENLDVDEIADLVEEATGNETLRDYIRNLEIPDLEMTAAERRENVIKRADKILRDHHENVGDFREAAWAKIFRAEGLAALEEEDFKDMRDTWVEDNREWIRDILMEGARDNDDLRKPVLYRSVRISPNDSDADEFLFDYQITKEGIGRNARYIARDDGGDEIAAARSLNALNDMVRGHIARILRDSDMDIGSVSVDQKSLPPMSEHRGSSAYKTYGDQGRNIAQGKRPNYSDIIFDVSNLPGEFGKSHFQNEKGYVAHVRRWDVDIPGQGRTNFIAEMQSDLFSAGVKGKKPSGFYSKSDKPQIDSEVSRLEKMASELDAKKQKIQEEANLDFLSKFARSIVKNPELAGVLRDIFKGKQGVQKVISLFDEVETDPKKIDLAIPPRVISNALAEKYGDTPYTNARRRLGSYFLEAVDNDSTFSREQLLDVGDAIVSDQILSGHFDQLRRAYEKSYALSSKADDFISQAQALRSKIPESPFGKQWQEFILNRMLPWSIERGYDAISYPTGNMLGIVEGWGSGQVVINRALDRLAAIRDRNDYAATFYLQKLGKDYGVAPKLVNVNTGKEYEGLKLTKATLDTTRRGHVSKTGIEGPMIVDENGKEIAEFKGMRNNIMNMAAQKYTEGMTDEEIRRSLDEETEEWAAKQMRENPEEARTTPYYASDSDAVKYYKTSVEMGRKIPPFKFQMWTVPANKKSDFVAQDSDRMSINLVGNDAAWVFKFNDKLIEDVLSKGVKGYWRGGLVRGFTYV